MTIVVDESIAVRWSFTLDRSDRAIQLLRSGESLIAPDLLVAEFINAAWRMVVFGGAPRDLAIDSGVEITSAFDELVPSAMLKDRALAIAFELRHPAYDCFYLALAESRTIQFKTADNRLLKRCADTRYSALVSEL